MKLGHIVKYHNVFFKFDNGHITPYLQEFVHKIHHFRWCPLYKTSDLDHNFINFVSLFSIIMSSSSLIMVHIVPCLQKLFIFENMRILHYQGHPCPMDS